MKNEQNATASIILDKLRPGKDGNYPVKLRIIFERKYRDYVMKYPTEKKENSQTINRLQEEFKNKGGQSITMSEEDFNKVKGEKPRGIFKTYKTF